MKERMFKYSLIAPCLIFILFVTIFPLLYSLILSFHYWDIIGGGPWRFVGLSNYMKLFREPDFWITLRTTLIIAAISLLLEFLIGLSLALILNQRLRGRRIFTTLPILTLMTTPVVTGLIWRMLYHEKYGPVNHFLGLFLGGWQPIPWLADPKLALITVIVTNVWQWSPFAMLVFLAGLQSIPTEIYEVAGVDGASGTQILRHITLPLLAPIFSVFILIRMIDLIKLFDFILILTRGGPGIATMTPSIFIYLRMFKYWDAGYACAQSYILLIISAVIITALLRFLRR